MQQSNAQQPAESYRMALRRYLCYGCDRQFGTMVNVNGINDIKCSSCGSDFVEEMRSVESNPQPAQQEQAPQQPQQQSIHQNLFQPNVGAQQYEQPMQQQRRIVTQRINSAQPRGYTRSVTISYGNGADQPQVQTFTSSNMGSSQAFQMPPVNFNSTNNIQMNMMGDMMGRREAMRGNPFEQLFQGMPQMMFSFGGDMEDEPQSQGVSQEFIDNLPPMKAGKEADCNICLEKVGSNGNKSCELSCGHAFDKSCLTTWLKEHDSCPVCRAKLDQDREQQPNQQQQQSQMQNPFQGFFGF